MVDLQIVLDRLPTVLPPPASTRSTGLRSSTRSKELLVHEQDVG